MRQQTPEKTEESKSAISRREFLKDAGLIVGGATVGSMALINACGATATVTAPGGTATKTVTVTAPGGAGVTLTQIVETQAGTSSIKMTVNGWQQALRVSPTDTLRDVLRDQLGLTSIKDMCNGYGACGSCTVIMDGRPVLSCMTLAATCEGAKVETTEGITAANHPLIEAYIVNNCMQCGYCTPGFVITAKALLDRKAKPSEADIREALGGNICRCATYPHHLDAVKAAAGV